jgi:putative peptide zinc metalloprotease protein
LPVDRPTFSESWYRVAELKPRLRSLVQSYRQRYRGRTWHVLRDSANNKFFRLDEASYHFVGLLNGQRPVADAWKVCCEQLGDSAPTQGEAIQLLGQLYQSNLLDADLPADAAGMFERFSKRRRKEVGGYFMNLLFSRIPLIDPDHFLDLWVKAVGWCFGPVGLCLWALLVGTGLWSIAGRAGDLWDQKSGILSPSNLPWLYVCMILIKAIHEFGHGFACKHFGKQSHSAGEVHTMGIMFIVFMPLPYVDVSSAWALRNKWHRAFIGAAGMYVEIAIGAAAAIIWARSAPDTLAHALSYNMIFIAGVTTILFNANPLIKFDGYYILSDILETPNLAQRGKDYLYYLVKKYAYGVRRPRDPSHSSGERFWLVVYAVAASIYRVFISVSIILFVVDTLKYLGIMLAMSGVIGWVIVPIFKWVHYLLINPELMRVRARAQLVTVVFLGLLFGSLGLIPAPYHCRGEGVVEPGRVEMVFAGADGFIDDVLPSATRVDAGGVELVSATNYELTVQRRKLLAERGLYEAYYRQARSDEPAQAQVVLGQTEAINEQLVRVEDQLDSLRIQPAFSGVWISEHADQLRGAYARQGEPIGMLADDSRVKIRVVLDQYAGQPVARFSGEGSTVEMRVRSRPDDLLEGRVVRVLKAARYELPSAALGYAGGGALAVDQQDQEGTRSQEPFWEVQIEPTYVREGDEDILYPGQRVVTRFRLPDTPLLQQWWLGIAQVIQKRF